MAEGNSWKIHQIKKNTKRQELLESISRGLGHTEYALSYKDHRPTAILITKEEKLPPIIHKGKLLPTKARKLEVKDVKDTVTPLHNLSYTEQLQTKSKPIIELAQELGCAKECIEVLESPIQTGYRNKCEFTFGFSEDSQPVLGFRAAKFADSPNLIADPKECTYHISKEMLDVVSAVNTYLSTREDLVYNRLSKKGYLRVLMLRKLGTELIGVLQVAMTPEEEVAHQADLQAFVQMLPVDSLYLECTTSTFEGFKMDSNLKQVKGSVSEYTQTLGGCTFKVPVLGFFQINLGTAEILVQLIRKIVTGHTILDLCCGSGVLGICAAKDTERRVVGIEVSSNAVRDAEANSKTNQIKGIYTCKSIEKVSNEELQQLLEELDARFPAKEKKSKDASTPPLQFSAILDPPRVGVSDKLMAHIASNEHISEIVYVSCNYRVVKPNLHTIIKKGFQLESVYVLDMFPYTKEAECVFHFKRSSASQAPNNSAEPSK
ncbi:tRNA (uracil-5-)-methyltransferase [Nematocida sp. AWRm77]|nr:tRNA (uracil-5-)-methyltransferase [Nematocida sp. AWRm77]